MKTKTIKIVLKKKTEEWLESITDEAVQRLAKKNTIITGGCIASMLLGEEVNDYDLYFRNKETVLAIANYYVQKFNSEKRGTPAMIIDDGPRIKIVVKSAGLASNRENRGYRYFEGDSDPNNTDAGEYIERAMSAVEKARKLPDFVPIYMSANAITLSGDIQLVLRFYGEPPDIHKNFDFVHCTNYWTSDNGELIPHPRALEALLAKELRYEGSLYPVSSIIRTRKFIARGWMINAGQYLKMAMQISALDLTQLDVLEEQLIGVDIAYFAEVVSLLKEKTEKDKPIDNVYLIEIIDRIF